MDPFLIERAYGIAPEFKTTVNGVDVVEFEPAEMQIETPESAEAALPTAHGVKVTIKPDSEAGKMLSKLKDDVEAAIIAKMYSLVIRYLRELSIIKGDPCNSFEKRRNEASDLLNHPQIKWHWLFDGEPTIENMCGFLAIGFRDNCHPDCDYFISQTYVESNHRRKGLMSAFFKQWLDEHKGATLCMFIIDKNEGAKKFWFKLMPELGYEPMKLSDVLPPDGYTTQYGWQPKKGAANNG